MARTRDLQRRARLGRHDAAGGRKFERGVCGAGLPAVPPRRNALRAAFRSSDLSSAATRFGWPTASLTAKPARLRSRRRRRGADLSERSAASGAGGGAPRPTGRRALRATAAVGQRGPETAKRPAAPADGRASICRPTASARPSIGTRRKAATSGFSRRASHAVAVHVRASQDNSSPVGRPTARASRSARGGTASAASTSSRRTTREAKSWCSNRSVPAMPMSWSGDRLVYWTRDRKTGRRHLERLREPAGDRSPPRSSRRRPTNGTRRCRLTANGSRTARTRPAEAKSTSGRFPKAPGRIQVSVNGGVFPRWRRDGRGLYFMNLVSLGSMMASDIRAGGASVQRRCPGRYSSRSTSGNLHEADNRTLSPSPPTVSDS